MSSLGRPRRHYAQTDSSNERARILAEAGAPHGTLVTAGTQRAGRGRQGRTWSAPPGRALLMSLIVKQVEPLLPLRAGVAVSDAAGPRARVKWPNDVLIDGRKVAGILVESRPQEGWAIVGIGVNVAVDVADLPPEVAGRAGTLGLEPRDVERVLERLLDALAHRLDQPAGELLATLRERDALAGASLAWADGRGTGAGIADDGGLRVRRPDGEEIVLQAGEVHLLAAGD
jgi:BirA family biotin operon repressor/biotin-[acetyl-CoA-carboxylase] ligase